MRVSPPGALPYYTSTRRVAQVPWWYHNNILDNTGGKCDSNYMERGETNHHTPTQHMTRTTIILMRLINFLTPTHNDLPTTTHTHIHVPKQYLW